METCRAMCTIMNQLNIAIDGGKDSLSMAAKIKHENGSEIVKSPGTLVISAYAPVPDIRLKVTPELNAQDCNLIYINLSGSKKFRLGGSALAQVYNQIGSDCPDIDDSSHLKACFQTVQQLIKTGMCTAGHDVSDGGLIVCLLEMGFASGCGLRVNIDSWNNSSMQVLFAEECAVVIEVKNQHLNSAVQHLKAENLNFQVIGQATQGNTVEIKVDGATIINVNAAKSQSIL